MNEVIQKIQDASRSISDADFLPAIFGRHTQDVREGRLSVVLYGAGSAGQHLFPALQLHGINAVCFCETSPSQTGAMCCGVPVISREELLARHRSSLVFITTNRFAQEIADQLHDEGFPADQICRLDADQLFYYVRFPHYFASGDELAENQDAIAAAYGLMSDAKSRDLFISRMALFSQAADYRDFRAFLTRFSDALGNAELDDARRLANSENYLYFNNDLVKLSEGECLVDGGAFDGDSAEEFIRLCKHMGLGYQHIHCFEPDAANYARLSQNLSRHPNTTPYPFGLWNESTTLRFLSSGQIMSYAARVIRNSGDTEVVNPQVGDMEIRTAVIDQLLAGQPVSFIKLDIEGAELEALEGAAEVIRTQRPKLAISAYHRRWDLYRIPLLIHRICPGYRMYLRHLSDNYYDTVLFALPE